MKTKPFHSFRSRLFIGMLIGSLIPLLLCSTLLLQFFRLKMMTNAEDAAADQMALITDSLDTVYSKFQEAALEISKNSVIVNALAQNSSESTQVYVPLFDITDGLRGYAHFDLYDRYGTWRYSTQSNPDQTCLPTNWGVLYAANHSDTLTFTACENALVESEPLYQGALALYDAESQPVGYLVISMYYANFQNILKNTYSGQNGLILLNQFWRPVYCSESQLAVSLASQLRQNLMEGIHLDAAADGFLYYANYHAPTKLHMILRQPDVFTKDTMYLLYTVSFGSALICIVISILASLKLSQQMSRPIERLHRGIGEVVHNNLDTYVSPYQNDELGELSLHFNAMVTALKHNQEELVKRQKDLNEAQIRMLQAQLSPHFLCNTLDTIKWIGKINQVPQVAEMSTSLADILRFCISPEEFVSLDHEVQIVRRYIEIQKIRLSSKFSFLVQLPEELRNCLVPKMILQPIVENAILHGINGKEGGIIRLDVQQTEGTLLKILVSDNGCGIPQHMTGEYAQWDMEHLRGHLGLFNVNTILQKYYGEQFGLSLGNCPDGSGAVVTAWLPIRREGET